MNILIHGIIGAVGLVVFFASISMASYKAGYQRAAAEHKGALREQRSKFAAAVDEYVSLPRTSAVLSDGTRASCVHLGRAYQTATNRLHAAAGYDGTGWSIVRDPLPAATPTQGEDQ